MHLRQLIGMLLVVSAGAAADERPVAPTTDCLDARAVVQAHQVDARRLLVETAQARHALTLTAACRRTPR